MQKIVPHVWFDDAAEEAAGLYTSLIPNSRIGRITRYGAAGREQHGQPEGRVMAVELEIDGTILVGINGGPLFRPTPAVSYFLVFDDRETVDRVWAGLIEGGDALMPLDSYGWSPRYGWLNDRFGVSWQVMQGDRAGYGRTVAPALMYTGDQAGCAAEAIAHYTALFPDSGVEGVMHHEPGGVDSTDSLAHARFRLAGQTFVAMDSAMDHGFGFSPANSHAILCDTQDEIDHYWGALSAVPEAERCGWLADRFGVSWQVVPRVLPTMLGDGDADKVARVTNAFMQMKKLEIAALEKAYAG